MSSPYPATYPRTYDQARDMVPHFTTNTTLSGTATKLWRMLVEGEEAPPRYVVMFHDTPLVTFYADGRIELQTGGFNGDTTTRKINACLVESIWRVISWQQGKVALLSGIHGTVHPFRYRAVIHPDGKIEADED